MACTLHALARFEWATGKSGPSHELSSIRTLLWALLDHDPLNPISEYDIGQMDSSEFSEATEAAFELLSSASPAPSSKPKDASSHDKTDWYGLWSLGRIDLSLSEEEFWALSPIQFDAMCKRLEAQQYNQLYGSAMICAKLHNVNRTKDEDPILTAEMFMPGEIGDAARHQLARDQKEFLRDKIRLGVKMLGGKEVKHGR